MAETGLQNGVEELRALTFLERTVGAIAATDDISAHMQSIVRQTTEVTGSQVCSLYLWDAEDEQLTLTATHGLPARAIGEVKLRVGEGITGWVARHREPVMVVDVPQDPRFTWTPGIDDGRYVAMLSIPVMRGAQLYGVLNVQSERGHVFTDAERNFLATIAAHLASVIEVTGLHRQLALTEALRVSEERLHQAQKMEAVGILAGGVAHDFNNLLTAINGFAHLIDHQLPQGSSLTPLVAEIIQAGQRAASLTGQLLAFSRRQVLQPEVLDLNVVVSEMGRMVDRLSGENIDVVVIAADDLGRVFVDRGQIEQVILNLAVNARDAMPQGGKFTIEAANVDLDEGYLKAHGPREIGIDQPGRYMMLAVSDTGTGIDRETQARIFEPFFTTKEPGKGTGLAWPPSTASSNRAAAISGCTASLASARPSRSICQCTSPRTRPKSRIPVRPSQQGARRSCWWRTRRAYGR